MVKVLGRKYSNTNEEWLEVFNNIERYISYDEVQRAKERALKEMAATMAEFKNPIYAYSGGKDSIVLADLCMQVGVKTGVMSITELEYPAFRQWIEKNVPDGVELVSTGQDLQWLAKHPDRFLCYWDGGDKQSPVNIGVQHSFYDKSGADVILLGRRKADNNYVGKGGSNIYTDSVGRTKYNPISDWTHETLLGYIRYEQLYLPPIYSWPDGFNQGTHPWFDREVMRGSTEEQTVREIVQIDSTLLAEAAKVVPRIAEFLKHI